MNKKSDIIDYDFAKNRGFKLLKDDKKCIMGYYIIFSINTGIKVSEILKIKHLDLQGEAIILQENNTVRKITLNNVVKGAYKKLTKKLDEINFRYEKNDFVFMSQKGTVYRPQSINVILKQIFSSYSKNQNISSLSLTKSFGRKIWENMNRSDYSLLLLSKEFSQNSVATTRTFLDIPKAETNVNLYLVLEK